MTFRKQRTTTLFVYYTIWFLSKTKCCEGRCAQSATILELYDSEPVSVRLHINGRSRMRNVCDVNDPPMVTTVVEVFKGTESIVPVGGKVLLYYLTDTGYTGDLPSELHNEGDFLAFPNLMDRCKSKDERSTAIMYIHQCNYEGNVAWSSVDELDTKILRGGDEYRNSTSSMLESGASSTRTNPLAFVQEIIVYTRSLQNFLLRWFGI